MNKTANNRTNSSKQTGSPGRDTTYSARYKATRRDALQSAKVRSNENVSVTVIGKGRPSSFPSESTTLPELKKSHNNPRVKNGPAIQSRNDNQSSRNSGRGSVTSYKPKVSPEPSRRVMSHENVRQETRSPTLNHTSQSYRDVRAMENGHSNQFVHPPNGDNRNNRNVSSNKQYDYMKPFVGTYPESHVARGPGQPNRNHNQVPEHAQNEVYAQKASFYDPRAGNGVQQEPSIQQGAQHHTKQEYGEYHDRRAMQPQFQGHLRIDNKLVKILIELIIQIIETMIDQAKGLQVMDDVGSEYEGNDVYMCYLKTDAGDVIGPLRLDIEDVQLGLPNFNQDKTVQNQDQKDQNQDSGMRNRQTGSHGLNEFSSRSHSMLTLTVDTEQVDPDDENLYLTKRGKLTFVDLAGSQKKKVKDSGSSAEMLIESNNINRSLLVLGKDKYL
ncbi:KIF12 [Mytilus edulis]|uniref:KIF12 n=1 Tax=Mytilus edulis TaxID=6550 RepID=A0A8S3R7X3_MYTED|nr:KIF12 [Mytilus edulis]